MRLISPPGLGGLACAEGWGGGRYARHWRGCRGHIAGSLGVAGDSSADVVGAGGGGIGREGLGGVVAGVEEQYCRCKERRVYDVLMDAGWEVVGIARFGGGGGGGRWVVEVVGSEEIVEAEGPGDGQGNVEARGTAIGVGVKDLPTIAEESG